MSKGSRQRTYGSKFEANWEKIFGEKPSTPQKASEAPSGTFKGKGKANP